ncbi:MAG: hypothetical protein JNL01_06585 [Bdellovibrionales bacterium]|nr:hypothetical protein [Bdellovibrionales bacterium]
MSMWMIIGWVCVGLLTAINVVVFMKLKDASEQMLKMAFPGSKNMGEALAQMQKMMGGAGGMGGFGGMPGGMRGGANQEAQLKAAMDMLKNLQKKR